jgi:hypothetical protein
MQPHINNRDHLRRVAVGLGVALTGSAVLLAHRRASLTRRESPPAILAEPARTMSVPASSARTMSVPASSARAMSVPASSARSTRNSRFNQKASVQSLLKLGETLIPKPFQKLNGDWELRDVKGSYNCNRKIGRVLNRKFDTDAYLVILRASESWLPMPDEVLPDELVAVQRAFTVCDSEIMAEIAQFSTSMRIFVLPSQFNSAEYSHPDAPVKDISAYLWDDTGGSRGQLACDPAVAQFILDNACSANNENGPLNNVKDIVKDIDSLEIKNGYLRAKGPITPDNVKTFAAKLHLMTMLSARDVCANGLEPSMRKFSQSKHKVDLMYASAMPAKGCKYVNEYANSTEHSTVAKMVLFAQYVCAFRGASQRRPCELYLMPLGGGVWNNPLDDIFDAMVLAYSNVIKRGISMQGVSVKILTWTGKPGESTFFNNCLRSKRATH